MNCKQFLHERTWDMHGSRLPSIKKHWNTCNPLITFESFTFFNITTFHQKKNPRQDPLPPMTTHPAPTTTDPPEFNSISTRPTGANLLWVPHNARPNGATWPVHPQVPRRSEPPRKRPENGDLRSDGERSARSSPNIELDLCVLVAFHEVLRS